MLRRGFSVALVFVLPQNECGCLSRAAFGDGNGKLVASVAHSPCGTSGQPPSMGLTYAKPCIVSHAAQCSGCR
jgi:hypothetical protein